MIALKNLGLTAPDGCVIGILTDDPSRIDADAPRIGPGGTIPGNVPAVILDHTFSQTDAVGKLRAMSLLHSLRNANITLLLISHDEALLANIADELWVIRSGKLIERGDPAEVLANYRKLVAAAFRQLGEGEVTPLRPVLTKGDGRAKLTSIELLGETGHPTSVWRSGEQASIRVTVEYHGHAADPVVGILIRTRVGLNVYGTNTELEGIHFGPVTAGDVRTVMYHFPCDLCPGDYTLTAASHDPDGLWHEWLEDAVAFSVSDSRYTAGVANLRAKVTLIS